jgi:Agrobacterium tumefaciens protein Atu4866
MKKLILILLGALLLTTLFGQQNTGAQTMNTTNHQTQNETQATHPYVGMWMTEDSYIRHELLPNGRYIEARGERENAYQGRYEVTGNHIDYWDDTGFTADGEFISGVLYHAGMVLYRQEEAQ